MTPFAPPQVALAVALASPPGPSRVSWCLCRVDALTNAPVVVQTVEAETRAAAADKLPPYPDHWFVTSRVALDTLGVVPVSVRGGFRVRRSA